MSELKNTSVDTDLKIANVVFKLYNKYKQNKSKDTLDELKNLLTKNESFCKISITVIKKLINDGFIDKEIVNTLITLANDSKFNLYAILLDGIFSILDQNYGPISILLLNDDREKIFYLTVKIAELLKQQNQTTIRSLKVLIVSICSDERYIGFNEILCQELLNLTLHQNESVSDVIYDLFKKSRNTSKSYCYFFNSFLQKILMNSLQIGNDVLSTDIILYLTAWTVHLVKNHFDPSRNFQIILNALKSTTHNKSYWNLLLCLLVDLLHQCHPQNVSDLLKIMKFLVMEHNVGSEITMLMILDALIQILAYPTFFYNYQEVKNLKNYIISEAWRSNENSCTTNQFKSQIIMTNPDIARAYNLCTWIESGTHLSNSTINSSADELFWTYNNLILRGLFIGQSLEFNEWKEVFKTLLKIANNDQKINNSLTILMFHKLANDPNPRMKIEILRNMVKLGFKNEIFNAINAMSKNLIRSFAIDLYLKIWIMEPRTYPFLMNALTEKSNLNKESNYELEIVKAATIKEICRTRPHQHGVDLVNFISDILNNSDGDQSEITASLALESICILCENHVINPVSTWKVISPKLCNEKRRQVLKAICKFFSIVSNLKSPTLQYELFYKEVLERLFNLILNTEEKEIIGFAFDALEEFDPENMTLDLIPEKFRDGFKLPDPNEESNICILDMEVPGECFFQMLKNSNPLGSDAAKKFLIGKVGREIDGLRQNNYVVLDNQPEPRTMKLSRKSVLKAITDFVIKEATTRKGSLAKSEVLIENCLQILAEKYSKPLPPLNWCFLHELLHHNSRFRMLALKIAARQSIISGTSKRLIENFLLNIDPENESEILFGFEMLVDLCNGISGEVLKLFLEFGLNRSSKSLLYKIYKTSETSLKDLKKISKEENLNILETILTHSLDNIEMPSDDFNNFIEVILALSEKFIQNLIKTDLVKNKEKILIIAFKKIAKDEIEKPVMILHEVIDKLVKSKRMEGLFLSELSTLLIMNDNLPKKAFIVDVIARLQIKMTESFVFEGEINFYFEILFSSAIISAGLQNTGVNGSFSRDKNQIYSAFPLSLIILSHRESWHDVLLKIFNMFHFIVDNPKIPNWFIKLINESVFSCKDQIYFQKSKIYSKFWSMQ